MQMILEIGFVLSIAAAPQVSDPPPPSTTEAQTIAEVPLLKGLEERWRRAMEELSIPGLSMAIVHEGKLLALDAFGSRNPDGDPVTPDTMFYIASATKPFLAMTALSLQESGDLGLDDLVYEYLPRFQLANEEQTTSISLRDLMCHRPGINHGLIVWQDAYTGQITEDAFYRFLAQVEAPMRLTYTNVHFTLLGRALEATAEKPWKDLVQEHILDPAGMGRTTAYASRMYRDPDVAIPMIQLGGKMVESPLRKTDRTMHAAGGMGTTARDAATWMLLNIHGGRVHGQRVLEEQSLEEMHKLHSRFDRPRGQIIREEGFGLGWQRGNYRGECAPMLSHGGGYLGAASMISFLPEHGVGISVLCNTSDNGHALIALIQIDVLDRLLEVKRPTDMLATTLQRVRQGPEKPTGKNPGEVDNGLSQPISAYLGLFGHEDRGTVRIHREGGLLRANIGDLKIRLFSKAQDQFRGWISPRSDGEGEFIIQDNQVVAVDLELNEGQMTRFQRVEGG